MTAHRTMHDTGLGGVLDFLDPGDAGTIPVSDSMYQYIELNVSAAANETRVLELPPAQPGKILVLCTPDVNGQTLTVNGNTTDGVTVNSLNNNKIDFDTNGDMFMLMVVKRQTKHNYIEIAAQGGTAGVQ